MHPLHSLLGMLLEETRHIAQHRETCSCIVVFYTNHQVDVLIHQLVHSSRCLLAYTDWDCHPPQSLQNIFQRVPWYTLDINEGLIPKNKGDWPDLKPIEPR